MKPEQDQLLEQLYRTYFHTLQVHAYRFLGNWYDAHVAAQETFHIACDKIETVMSHPNPVGWLKNVTKNVSRNMIRARQRQLLLFSSLEELLSSEVPFTCDERSDDPTEMFEEFLTEEDRYLLKAHYAGWDFLCGRRHGSWAQHVGLPETGAARHRKTPDALQTIIKNFFDPLSKRQDVKYILL